MARTFRKFADLAPTTQQLMPKDDTNTIHRLIALHVALGHSNVFICQQLNLSASRVSVVRRSPAIQQLIKTFQQQIEEKTLASSAVIRLAREFDPSVEKIAELRDTGDEQSTQLSAAKFLAEKFIDAAVPKKTINEEQKKVGVFVFSGEETQRLLNVMREEDDESDAEIVKDVEKDVEVELDEC